jgi:hypothetical protein
MTPPTGIPKLLDRTSYSGEHRPEKAGHTAYAQLRA